MLYAYMAISRATIGFQLLSTLNKLEMHALRTILVCSSAFNLPQRTENYRTGDSPQRNPLMGIPPVTSSLRNACSLHVACPLLLSDLYRNWNMSTNISNVLISNSVKIHSVVDQLLHADGQTDRTF